MPCMRIPALQDMERRNRRLERNRNPVRALQVIGARRRVAIRRRPGRALQGDPKDSSGNLEWKGKVMADKAEFACECDYMCGRRLAERVIE